MHVEGTCKAGKGLDLRNRKNAYTRIAEGAKRSVETCDPGSRGSASLVAEERVSPEARRLIALEPPPSLSKPPRLFAKRTLHHDQFTNVLRGK